MCKPVLWDILFIHKNIRYISRETRGKENEWRLKSNKRMSIGKKKSFYNQMRSTLRIKGKESEETNQYRNVQAKRCQWNGTFNWCISKRYQVEAWRYVRERGMKGVILKMKREEIQVRSLTNYTLSTGSSHGQLASAIWVETVRVPISPRMSSSIESRNLTAERDHQISFWERNIIKTAW